MRLQYFRGNVFVANLPPDLTEDELAEAFDPFGIVLSAFIARDPENGKRLRYGLSTSRPSGRAAGCRGDERTAIGGHKLDVRISEAVRTRRALPAPPVPECAGPAPR